MTLALRPTRNRARLPGSPNRAWSSRNRRPCRPAPTRWRPPTSRTPRSRSADPTSPSTSRRRRCAARPRTPIPTRSPGLAVLVDGGENVTIRNLTRARLQDRHPRARQRASCTSRAPTSATTGSRGSTASSSTRACSTGCRTTTTRRTSGSRAAPGSISPTRDGAEIDHTTIVQGQNGLMLARSNSARDLEQRLLVPLRPRHRALSRQRQPHHAQQGRLVRARLQPRASTTAARTPPASSSTSRATRTSSPSTR